MSYYVLQPAVAGLLIVLGAICGALALRAFTAGRVRVGLRHTGWALVPFGLLAIGVSGLLARLVGAFTRWAFQLVFSPVSWLGMVLLVAAGALVFLTRDRVGRSADLTGVSEVPNPYAALPESAAPQRSGVSGPSRSTRAPGASGLLAELEEMGLLDDK